MLAATTTTTTTSCCIISRLRGWKFCCGSWGNHHHHHHPLLTTTSSLQTTTSVSSSSSPPNRRSCMMRYYHCAATSLPSGTTRSTFALFVNSSSTLSSRRTMVTATTTIISTKTAAVAVVAACFSTTRIPGRRTRGSSRGGGGSGGGTPEDTTRYNSIGDMKSDAVGSEHSSSTTRMMISMEEFHSAANALLDKVEEALTKLKDCNDRLEIVRYPPTAAPLSSSSTTTDDSIRIDNGTSTAVPDDATISQHGGKIAITVLSSADLYWGGGTYSLTIYPDDYDAKNDSSDGVRGGGRGGGMIALQSPLSGTYTYVYNVSTKEWVGEEDGHSLLGMLTRDWIRQCNGVPDF